MKLRLVPTGKAWLFLTALFILAVYFLGMRQLLAAVLTAQIEMYVLGALALVLVVAILFLLFTLLAITFTKDRTRWHKDYEVECFSQV